MLIVTTLEIPGYKIDAVLGEVMGMTVRSATSGANLAGVNGRGEISEYTNMVYESRNQVMQRMWDQCVQRGGNAIVGMRFDTADIAASFSEVCAYGTAVVIRPIATEVQGGTPQSIAHAAGQPNPGIPSPQPQGYAPQQPQEYAPQQVQDYPQAQEYPRVQEYPQQVQGYTLQPEEYQQGYAPQPAEYQQGYAPQQVQEYPLQEFVSQPEYPPISQGSPLGQGAPAPASQFGQPQPYPQQSFGQSDFH
jgi:uncharacterized protein YbjQ (UPF0145 family)